jgi:hypothetical protein
LNQRRKLNLDTQVQQQSWEPIARLQLKASAKKHKPKFLLAICKLLKSDLLAEELTSKSFHRKNRKVWQNTKNAQKFEAQPKKQTFASHGDFGRYLYEATTFPMPCL